MSDERRHHSSRLEVNVGRDVSKLRITSLHQFLINLNRRKSGNVSGHPAIKAVRFIQNAIVQATRK
jgi:hypothetical protein